MTMSIIDYGIGNVGSIANMLKRVNVPSTIAKTADDILAATSLILPGVGAFDRGMENLAERGFIEPLTEKVINQRTPILGLCLGMQLFAESSEEGKRHGLGWITGRCVRFVPTAEAPIKVPHMGWNRLEVVNEHPLVADLGPDQRFYFVHGYHLVGVPFDQQVALVMHGSRVPAVVASGNVMGVQFHPEKSHRYGVKLMSNFAEIAGAFASR